MTPRFRTAGPGDAEAVARLHADSWRRHYRGAYSDAYLDGDVLADRLAVWSGRLAAPAGARTLLAEDGTGVLGFVHVVPDEDPKWGSLVDNLHVTAARKRTGVGRALLARAAEEAVALAESPGLYLWVLEQNTAARAFYAAMGAEHVETALVGAPGGDPARLNGTPTKFRMAWPDNARLPAA
ncbi:GNAT family N-acetyltransferase [Actinacidiphila paucisporea]|uniref:Ribosomal protein S18 acetylase RimI n=1 Tax=Actinacidiphila paucisporea TaxID=310782 RepID=A0A1M7ESF5_9ACTN|nr:GNAT family N-acetyltransferase [Actinacidiphila paucisporea]SHL94419.1 Ribosomal protein S18 acetylase RimI [Actinacidiphila paucisporea]